MSQSMDKRLSQLRDRTLDDLLGRSLLITPDWTLSQLESLLRLAEAFEALDRARVATPLLANELAYAIFFDNSTRTKSAWAGASARLGMKPVIVDGESTQVEHGETAEETGAMLGMNSHALGVRHDKFIGEGNSFMRDMLRGIEDYLGATEDSRKVPMVNLQCDIDHPTQALADLLWLRDHFGGDLRGKKVTMSWAYAPSYAKPLSVAQGIIMLLPRFGMDVTLAHPEGYQLTDDALGHAKRSAEEGGGSFRVVHDMDEAFRGAHVVYPKSWGPYELMQERVTALRAGEKARLADIERRSLEQNKKSESWICDERRMALTDAGKALYMHCLPADIGKEVTPGVYDRYRVEVSREANKKVYAIMALLAGAKVPDLAGRLGELAR